MRANEKPPTENTRSFSAAHKEAVEILNRKKEDLIGKNTDKIDNEHIEKTNYVFNTVYYLAQTNRPYTDHPDLTDLQKKNGLSVGRILQSNVSAQVITDFISKEMRKKTMTLVKESGSDLTVMIDESTTVSEISCLAVYLRCSINQSGPITFLLQLVELKSMTAENILIALLNCLERNGIDENYLSEHLVGFCSDGASVMLGCKSGVFTRLKQKFPRIIGWHCMNHRIELSVNDAVKATGAINDFKIFLDTLYALYSQFPKNKHELAMAAAEVDGCMRKIGRMLGTRWVASSFRTAKAVWISLSALSEHFSKASTDNNRDARERAKFSGLRKKIVSFNFVYNLALMYDALEELKDTSEALQSREISFAKAIHLINRQIEIFEGRKETNHGPKVKELEESIKSQANNEKNV